MWYLARGALCLECARKRFPRPRVRWSCLRGELTSPTQSRPVGAQNDFLGLSLLDVLLLLVGVVFRLECLQHNFSRCVSVAMLFFRLRMLENSLCFLRWLAFCDRRKTIFRQLNCCHGCAIFFCCCETFCGRCLFVGRMWRCVVPTTAMSVEFGRCRWAHKLEAYRRLSYMWA